MDMDGIEMSKLRAGSITDSVDDMLEMDDSENFRYIFSANHLYIYIVCFSYLLLLANFSVVFFLKIYI